MTYISIILTAYNDATTVRQCLESIIAQENADMQLECVIVDDCSTDDTPSIIRRIVGSYTGNISFHIYRHQTHHGHSRSRNTGLLRANGYYVLFVNATDTLQSGCIDTYMVNLMRHWDADVIIGNVNNVSQGQILFKDLTSAKVIRGKGDVLLHEMLLSHLYLYACNKLVRKEILSSNQIVFAESQSYADLLWSFTVFSCVSSIVLLPDVTYNYYSHSINVASLSEKWVNGLLGSYTATCDMLLDRAPRPESSDDGYYQAHQLFIYGLMSHAALLQKEFPVNSQVRRELSHVRSRLISQTKNDGQKILYLYFKQEGSLLSGVFKNPFFKKFDQLVDGYRIMLDIIVGH